MRKLISVIIPIYRVEEYLRVCVDSVLNQTYGNIEIILVDDGSPDACPAICDEYAESDSRILVIHKKNGGLSDARNAGLEKARGEYIFFLDSDDFIAEDTLEKLYGALKDSGSDIAECNVYSYREGMCAEYFGDAYALYETNVDIMTAYIRDNSIRTVVWNKLYKRELLNDIRFEKGKYNEDEFFTYKVLSKTDRLVRVPDFFCFYRQRRDSIMGEGMSLKRLDAVEGMALRADFIREHYPELYYYELRNITNICAGTYGELLKNKKVDPDGKGRRRLKKYLKHFKWNFSLFRRAESKLKIRIIGSRINVDLFERVLIRSIHRGRDEKCLLPENAFYPSNLPKAAQAMDSEARKISVVVAVYNSDEYLRECVESLINQTYRNIEIILVDDGATDSCPEICDEFAGKDSRIKVIHKKNGGTADARNRGVEESSGKYIFFIDGDDFIAEDTLEKLLRASQMYSADIAECNVYKYYSAQTKEFYSEKKAFYGNNRQIMRAYIKDTAIKTVVWNKLYRKSLLENTPFIKGTRNEDEYYTYRVLAKADRFVHIEDFCCYYRQRENSLTSGRFSLAKLDTMYGIAKRAEFIRDNYHELYFYDLRTVTYACLNSYKELVRDETIDPDGGGKAAIKDCLKRFRWSFGDFIRADLKLKLRLIFSHVSIELWAKTEVKLGH